MKISVVVPVYNRKEEIKRCVNALLNQDYPKKDYEIIVIDDGSTEDLSFLKEMGIGYFKQKNMGPAVARNLGVKKAKGEFILFTDSDCIPDREWIKEIIKTFRGDVACVGGKTIEQENRGVYNLLTEGVGIEDKTYFATNNAAYLKKAFEEVNGFNENFDRPGAEDVELCLRVKQRGYKIKENPKAIVYHYHSNTFKGRMKQAFNFGFGDLMFMLIHPNKKQFRPFFIFYILLLGVKISLKQIQNNIIYLPIIYVLNVSLLYSNLFGKFYHALKKGELKLFLYVPLHNT